MPTKTAPQREDNPLEHLAELVRSAREYSLVDAQVQSRLAELQAQHTQIGAELVRGEISEDEALERLDEIGREQRLLKLRSSGASLAAREASQERLAFEQSDVVRIARQELAQAQALRTQSHIAKEHIAAQRAAWAKREAKRVSADERYAAEVSAERQRRGVAPDDIEAMREVHTLGIGGLIPPRGD